MRAEPETQRMRGDESSNARRKKPGENTGEQKQEAAAKTLRPGLNELG
jgi:hypothetical protein